MLKQFQAVKSTSTKHPPSTSTPTSTKYPPRPSRSVEAKPLDKVEHIFSLFGGPSNLNFTILVSASLKHPLPLSIL